MNHSSNEPVFLIGLDSADFYLVEKWASEGLLPHLQALIAEGSWGRLQSTADVGSGTVWPSLFTGTSTEAAYVLLAAPVRFAFARRLGDYSGYRDGLNIYGTSETPVKGCF